MIVGGTVRVPGDKSITHRALLLAAMARGASHLGGALTSLDAKSTARVLRQLGAEITPLREASAVRVVGRGRLRRPARVLNCGNSGTTARLVLGLLAGHRFAATLTGDRSLRGRPMRRVSQPLRAMGASFTERNGDGLPLTISGGTLRPLRYELPVSSAQIKGCLLLAGVSGRVAVSLREPSGVSRDHTERLLRSFGFSVTAGDGWIDFVPDGEITPFDLQVPGDPSSAAFPVGAAVLAEGGDLRIADVGVNPTRIGFLHVLQRMGASVKLEPKGEQFHEPVGDLIARPARLRSTGINPREIPTLIDEVPLLAVLASRAEGTTVFREVGELRVKESDRLGLLTANLRAVGTTAEVLGNDLVVTGSERPPRGSIRTAGDHRLAMAFAVLGTVPGARVQVDDLPSSAVSYPGFVDMLKAIKVRGKR